MDQEQLEDGGRPNVPSRSYFSAEGLVLTKRDVINPPSPTPTCCTALLRPSGHSPPEVPSTSVPEIRIRPIRSLMDPDDQRSCITSAGPTSNTNPAQLQLEVKDDWRCKQRRMSDRIKYIFGHQNTFYDVVFQVKNEMIKAHQLLLKIASPVFQAILQDSALVPSGQNSSDNEYAIPIPEIEPKIFKQLLKFIYTDEISKSTLTNEETLSLLRAAKTFRLNELYGKCKRMLQRNINKSIAVQICEVATLYKDEDFREMACCYMAEHARSIFKSDFFLQLSEENLGRLLDRDDLHIDELSVFTSVVRWARSKLAETGVPITSSNLREVLADLLFKIRFPLMKAQEMALHVSPTNIFLPEKYQEIINYVCVDPTQRGGLAPIPYLTTPRISKKRSRVATPEKGADKDAECIELTSSTAEDSDADTVSATSSSIQNKHGHVNKRRSSHSSTASGNNPKKRKTSERETRFVELFGEEEEEDDDDEEEEEDEEDNSSPMMRAISLNNKDLNLNEFIAGIPKKYNLSQIESIVLDNVKIANFKELSSQKLRMENLSSFKMNITTDHKTRSLLQSEDFHLEKLLFFTTGGSFWHYKDLFKTGISVEVIINKVVVLKIAPNVGHVVVNKFSGAPNILKSLREEAKITSLVYSHSEFIDSHFPVNLDRLVILSSSPDTSVSMSKFVERFSRLRELVIFPAAGLVNGKKVPKPMILDKNLQCRHKLKILGLKDFLLSIHDSLHLKSLEALYLWDITWEKNVQEKFHYFFPNLVQVFLAKLEGNVKLLKNMLKLSSLKVVVSWNVGWKLTEADVKDIRQRYKVSLNCSEKNFCITKLDNGTWEYTKLNYDGFLDHVYEKFKYEFLYKDCQTFKKSC